MDGYVGSNIGKSYVVMISMTSHAMQTLSVSDVAWPYVRIKWVLQCIFPFYLILSSIYISPLGIDSTMRVQVVTQEMYQVLANSQWGMG